MKEVVWVIGTSATGKKTLIKNIQNEKVLLQKLGWNGKSITASSSSLRYTGRFKDRPVAKREGIAREVAGALTTADVVLIKWQYADYRASRPEKFRKLFPEARHRVLLLKAPTDTLVERLKRRENTGDEELQISAELKALARCIRRLPPDLEASVLNADGSHWKLSTTPDPNLRKRRAVSSTLIRLLLRMRKR
jgi:ribose 1,5-bisphosphokinase PhnN